MINLLMLSNSTMPGTEFFTWPKSWVEKFLGAGGRKLVFIPFAAVTLGFDEYEERVKAVFDKMGHTLQSIHRQEHKTGVINESDGIVVGGGNTFALLSRIYSNNVLEAIRKKVNAGSPYVGWSAGANLACPTIMTTNDMPVIQPPSFEALNLVPFQINPHYHELKFENQGGETRKERLEEFLVLNPKRRIIGLPEGMGIQRNGDAVFLIGSGMAKLYEFSQPIRDLKAGQDLSFLLR